MVIKVENLIQKNIINFYLPRKITADNHVVITTQEQQPDNPLCHAIWQISGITQCLMAENLLAVKYDDANAYAEIKLLVLAEIDDYIAANGPIINSTNSLSTIATAEILADSLIRPTLNRDGGDISFVSFNDGIITIQFTGHCAGCPYAQNTLNNVVTKTLRHYIPEINQVQVKE